MNRFDLQILANIRVKEAKVLLDNKCFEGAYYLLGYAIECAFKACIAKQTKRFDFPDQRLVNDSYTHNIARLLEISGLKVHHEKEIKRNPNFAVNWTIVKDWSEQYRYINNITELKAKDIYSAVTARKTGVLTWIKRLW
ncbi:MAG: DNA-binding protein [Nitrospirae bacterium]|nr:DNA-binding protein [Nitrospirota bacterium]